MCKQDEKHQDNPLAGTMGASKIIKKAAICDKSKEFEELIKGVWDAPKEKEILGVLQNGNIMELENYQGFSEQVEERAKAMAFLEVLNERCHYAQVEVYKRNLKIESVLIAECNRFTVERAFIDIFGHSSEFDENGPLFRIQGIPIIFSSGLKPEEIKFIVDLGL